MIIIFKYIPTNITGLNQLIMNRWNVFAVSLLYLLAATDCQGNKIGQSCRTLSGTPGSFQRPSGCPSLKSSSEGSRNVTIICCPHQTLTRSAGARKTTNARKNPRRNTKATTAPNLRITGCGEGGLTKVPQKTRRTRNTKYHDQYYKSDDDYDDVDTPVNGDIHDEDLDYPDDFNMTTSMIVGGSQAEPYSWPWMAGIFRSRSANGRPICGGTVVTTEFIVTAAHCLAPVGRASSYSVKVGAHTVTDGERHNVLQAYVHPQYRNFYNDIGLLRLKERLSYNDHVKPVCLPSAATAGSMLSGKSAVVTGWGTTRSGGYQSRVLKQAVVRVVPTKECDASYSRLYRKRKVITTNQMCANNPGTDTCQGDSGGPMVMPDINGKWTLVGVTSFGQGCAQLRYPGVYTRVGAYLSWIKSIVSPS